MYVIGYDIIKIIDRYCSWRSGRMMYVRYQNNMEYNRNTSKKESFILDSKPDHFHLSQLPSIIVDWIEKHGFDFITICDQEGRIIYASSSIEKVLGYHSEDIIGSEVVEYFSPNDQDTFLKQFEADADYRQEFSIQVRNAIGKYIWLDAAITSIFIKDKKKQLFITLSKDITDKKEAEEMLIRSEKMSVAGQLAAGVVHEIRNPLTSLKGFVDLLQAGIDRKDEYYKIMIDEIEKIETISSELLFISKPLTDKRSDQLVKGMLEDVITLLNTQAKTYNIKLDLQIDDDFIVYCDRTQMKQVFINLIKNAIEEMADGGVIIISVSEKQQKCSVAIIDQGPGIPDHLIHKIKEPFFTTKKEGTGLGLMITSKIVENHHGEFNIRKNLDKGSTFEIILPLVTKDISYT